MWAASEAVSLAAAASVLGARMACRASLARLLPAAMLLTAMAHAGSVSGSAAAMRFSSTYAQEICISRLPDARSLCMCAHVGVRTREQTHVLVSAESPNRSLSTCTMGDAHLEQGLQVVGALQAGQEPVVQGQVAQQASSPGC